MKVLEAQSAVLDNYEVRQHLKEQNARYKRRQYPIPANLKTSVDKLLEWFNARDSSSEQAESAESVDEINLMTQTPLPFSQERIATLLERLRPFDLSKGEVLMIINIRPRSFMALNGIIDEMPERLTDEQQLEVVEIIGDVLGRPSPPQTGGAGDARAGGQGAGSGKGGADVTMKDT